MFPINHLPLEQTPPHQRDFRPGEEFASTAPLGDSRLILLVVVGYLVAIFGGIVVLRALTPLPDYVATATATEVQDR